MDLLHRLLTAEPLLALFLTIALGYLVGKLKAGNFVLGGIAGTLLVGVVIGQFGVDINSGIKAIFFALFIYAVGFQGGPQFFHALNRRSLNQLNELPEDRKVAINQELRHMLGMPDDQRRAYMNTEEFRNRFSPTEQQMIGNLAEILPARD